MKSTLTLSVLVVWTLTLPALAQDLSPDQIEVLETLHDGKVAKAIATADQAATWASRLQQAQGSPDREKLALEIAASVRQLAAGELQQQLGPSPYVEKVVAVYSGEMAPVLERAEQQWRNATFVAEEFEGFTEENFREEAKRRAEARAAEELNKIYDTSLFPLLQSLRDPALYFKNFSEGKLREWAGQPVALGDDDSLQAQLVIPPPGTPLFAQSTEYGVKIVYLENDLKVDATGVRLEFQPGQGVPKINIDNLRVDSNLEGMVFDNVAALGQEFAGGFGLPIKVTLKGAPDFSAGSAGARGGLPFDVEIKLLEGMQARADNLILYPNNRVDWKNSSLLVKARTESPVPIGTTPFAMWHVQGELNPQTKEITLRSGISTMVSPPEAIGLDVGLTTQVPIKSLKLDGHLICANQKFMKTEGVIDFETGEISGRFQSSDEGSPLAGLAFADGTFSLKRERFLSDGRMTLFGKSFADMHCELDFVDGSGEFYATSGFQLFGANFASTLTGRIEPGFRRVTLEAMQSLTVSGIEPFGDVDVVVTVSADSNQPDKIHVVAEAFGSDLRAEFDVDTLGACTAERLRKELQANAVKSYHRLLKGLADGEEDGRKFAAKLDQKVRKYFDEKFGGAWTSGVPELDNLAGELSQGVKNAGGAINDAVDAGVGGFVDLREGFQANVPQVDSDGVKVGGVTVLPGGLP